MVKSRQQAQQFIRAGQVRSISGEVLDKPGQQVSNELEVMIKQSARFVSRGGEKLFAALNQFPIKVKDRVCLDAGISTGGFTDCLLQLGASRVYGVDVGYGQTAWNIRNNPRVVLLERTNIRYLKAENLFRNEEPKPDLAVADLSFISLSIVLPAIIDLLKKNKSELLLLVKPQFEVGRDKVGKGGVVRDSESHIYALNSVIKSASSLEWFPQGLIASPLTGPAGNHEYLLWLAFKKKSNIPLISTVVNTTLN